MKTKLPDGFVVVSVAIPKEMVLSLNSLIKRSSQMRGEDEQSFSLGAGEIFYALLQAAFEDAKKEVAANQNQEASA